jgi:leucyl aminopeptidase
MNITVQQGEIQNRSDEAIIVNLFEGARRGGATAAVDKASGGLISTAVDSGDFSGKRNQTLLLYAGKEMATARIIVVGLGKKEAFNLEVARQAAGTAARELQHLGIRQASTILHGSGAGGLDVVDAAEAVAEASALACYRFDEYKTSGTNKKALRKLTVIEPDRRRIPTIRRGVRAGLRIADATCLARDLINQPGNKATPTYLAQTACRIAREGERLRCQVLDEAAMKRLGMGALLAVSRGSAEPARFIILEYNKKANRHPPLVFVGKGVTFDSGGISIKQGAGMEAMKRDMSGAAAVLGAMQAISSLKLPLYAVGLVPATENLLDGKAFKPGDILQTLSGKTIEILNTDAEGRLILADALTYAERFKPAGVVDLATLTGACVTALGHHATGMMSTDETLAARVRAAGERTAERVWPLPLWDEYREQIKSDVADLKNTGGRPAGAITAAALLAEFAQGYPWVHLDIAGTAWTSKAGPYVPKGGVGVGVRLLTQLARDWPKKP